MDLRHGDRYLKHLASVPLFAELDREDLLLIAANSTEMSFDEGQELMVEGDRSAELFVITKGTASVRRGGREIATLEPGDFAGELGLVQHRLRNSTVVTTSPVEALVLNRREFSALLDDLPGFERKILLAMAARLVVVDNGSIH